MSANAATAEKPLPGPANPKKPVEKPLSKIIEKSPGFAGLALTIKHSYNPRLPHLGAAGTNSIQYGPEFYTLELPEQCFVASHEIMHISLRHVDRGEQIRRRKSGFDHRLYNIAADAIINSSLLTQKGWMSMPKMKNDKGQKEEVGWTLEKYLKVVRDAYVQAGIDLPKAMEDDQIKLSNSNAEMLYNIGLVPKQKLEEELRKQIQKLKQQAKQGGQGQQGQGGGQDQQDQDQQGQGQGQGQQDGQDQNGQDQNGQGQGQDQQGQGQNQPGGGSGSGVSDQSTAISDGDRPLTQEELQDLIDQLNKNSDIAKKAQTVQQLGGVELDVDVQDARGKGEDQMRKDARDWHRRIVRGQSLDGTNGLLRQIAGDLPETKTPWEHYLRSKLTRALISEPEENPMRPSRRNLSLRSMGIRNVPYEPGITCQRMAKRMVVMVDTSGSIDDELLRRFAAEIRMIMKRTNCVVKVIVCDCKVHGVFDLKEFPSKIETIEFNGRGGTDFRPAFEEAEKHKPDIGVYFTDMMGTFPEKASFTTVWARIPEPMAQGIEPPFDHAIDLD